MYKRRTNIERHPNLTEENITDIEVISDVNITPIPVGNIAQNTSLPPQFRYYYDYAGRLLGRDINSIHINFFDTARTPLNVYEPHDVYFKSHVFDISGDAMKHIPRALKFSSDELFGRHLGNLTLLKHLITYRSEQYRRMVDDIDPQIAYLMFTDTSPGQRWAGALNLLFKGMYTPPVIVIPNVGDDDAKYIRDVYYMAYFLLCHAVYNSNTCSADSIYNAPKTKKRLCFREFRGANPVFFNHPYIRGKLEWAAGRTLSDMPSLNDMLFDLLINPFRNVGGRKRFTRRRH